MSAEKNYKIVLIGDRGVGKTCFLKRVAQGSFENRYISTTGVEVQQVSFNTTSGNIIFNVWDCAGQEKQDLPREDHYLQADAAIVFFDVTSRGKSCFS